MADTAMRHWDLGGARKVLALHCSLAHSGAFAGLSGHLSDVQLYAPDLPGHGKAADWDGTGDLHGLASDLVRGLVADLGQGGPVDLIGHSFGGTLALRFAGFAPERVRSLTLIEPVLFAAARGTPAWDAFALTHRPFQTALQAGDRDTAAALFLDVWGGGGRFADMPAQMQSYMRDRIHLIAAQDGALNDDNAGILAPGRLEAVRAPVLIVEGAATHPVIGAIHAELARRLPDVCRLVVPQAGHMVALTHPAVIGQAVMKMWA